jgi:3-mercaptopyruvate sulfurtransferase SseA
MIFEAVASGGCRSYLIGCEETCAAATLRQMGFQRAVALDGGMKAWRQTGYMVKAGKDP